MLDHAVLQSVAKQLLNNTKIDLDGEISRVTRTSSQHLRTTTFEMDGRQFQAIEQNATPADGDSSPERAKRSSSSKTFRPTDL